MENLLPDAIIIALSATVVVLSLLSLGLQLRLKHDVRQTTRQLHYILSQDTRITLTTTTFNREIAELQEAINTLILRQQAARTDFEREELAIRQAIANVSHDLRTPLTSALGYVQLIEDEQATPEQRQQYAAIVRAKLDALTALIEELFAYSRLAEGEPLKLERLDLAALTREALAISYTDFEAAGFQVQVEIPEQPIPLIADAEALRRILQNLLANALVHGCDMLTVQVSGAPASPRLAVSNTVPRPEAIDPDRLFERFYTADPARSQRQQPPYASHSAHSSQPPHASPTLPASPASQLSNVSQTPPSSGLGLAIVKSLAEKHQAHLSATLQGDTLTITLEFPANAA
ncbi:MAG: HAMP domain-containing histidine kinase [Coriobacteriales bacterium]|nr:HAMP domain-containing histidine kinase [Coriobacteriales bacterium]